MSVVKESFRFRGWKKVVAKLFKAKNRELFPNERLYELWKLAYTPLEVLAERAK